MTDTAKPTPGPWVAKRNQASRPQEGVYVDSQNGGIIVACWGNLKHREADAALIAEAGTVYHETNLTPRQLLEQRNRLASRVRDLESLLHQGIYNARSVVYNVEQFNIGRRGEKISTQEDKEWIEKTEAALAKCGKVGG
jgi:hypothetical protein